MEEQLILYVRYTAKPGCRESFVRDIVEDCGINRNSFYYHFQDIPSLLGDPDPDPAGGRLPGL